MPQQQADPQSPPRTADLPAAVAALLIAGTVAALAMLPPFDATPERQIGVVRTEIKQIGNALVRFKIRFGHTPPSRITLYEQAEGWKRDKPAVGALRLYFPQFDFQRDRDINGDGTTTDVLELTGAECLVFFLGGMMVRGEPIGFGKHSANPFNVSEEPGRIGPFFDFAAEQLVDVDGDGMREYVIAGPGGQSNPLLYASSYNGRGYRQADLAVFGTGDSRNLQDVYRVDASQPWNRKTYQLISPGRDGRYGRGGIFDPDHSDRLPRSDRDNIVNFHIGALGD